MRIVPTSVLRLVGVVPAVVVSLLIELMAFSLMPDLIAVPLELAFVVLIAALALGFLESPTARLLTWARAPSSAELAVWSPVEAHLRGDGEVRRVWIRRRPGVETRGVERLGRESLVLAPGLLDALYHRQLTVLEVAALTAHTEEWHRNMSGRGGLATVVLSTPWRVLTGVFAALAGALCRLPLGGVAWTFRGVIGLICVVQSIVEGRAWSGILAAW